MNLALAIFLAAAPPLSRGYEGPASADADAGEGAGASAQPGRGYQGPVAAGEGAPARAPTKRSATPKPSPRPTPEPAPEPARAADEGDAAEDDAVDLDALDEVPEETIGDEAEDDASEVRTIVVTTDLLGGGQRIDLFRHAGGRALVEVDDTKDLGISSVGEALDRMPGVRAVEGNAGIGSTSTKLNVGVRGANPRLSSEATVMLDEVPIAPAPYGQPQLSLFPISLFSIDRIDAVRGGSSVRFGPRTSGGVFNLISHPIPEHPRISVFAQSDQFGDAGLATSYGGTHRGVGMYLEYAPRFGRTYREHSEFQAHGGLIKLAFSPSSTVDLLSTTHLFFEDSNLPGGLNEKQYAEGDRFRSIRPYDRFEGDRAGTSLRLRWRPREEHELQTIAFFSHTYRMSVMERQVSLEGEAPTLYFRPRQYDIFGLEPRYALRIRHPREIFQDLSFGGRFMYEAGHSRECREISPPDMPGVYTATLGETCRGLVLDRSALDPAIRRDGDARIAAYAAYVDDKLYLLDTTLVITGGARLELAQLSGRNNLSQRSLSRFYWQVLPAASIWYGPIDEVALFAGYGRSFGPSQFLQVDTATSDSNYQLNPEIADMVEGGIKLLELGGVYADFTGWYRYYRDLTDIGETQVDRIAGAHVYGVETDVSWEPGEVWEAVEGLELNVGYAWTQSKIAAGQYTGNHLAWYPAHEVWGSAGYEFPFGLKLGSDVSYNSSQFTDYANRPAGYDASGATGVIPAYTLVGAFARLRASLPSHWQVEVTFGVKNLLGEEWFMRTDDENRGILAMRPRTFYLNLGFSHDFLPRGRRAARRRDVAARQPGIAGFGVRRSPRAQLIQMMRMGGAFAGGGWL
ncbi:MAG: TonB-dependent receptor [Myxococcales bacterium]|nr:TonB-dependent receptor [Myxococcales bacterium]